MEPLATEQPDWTVPDSVRADVPVRKRDRRQYVKEHKKQFRIKLESVWSVSQSMYLTQCPPENPSRPEIAVFGRSNVGKSSLINYLCDKKLLATISNRPGHTKLIQHFLVDKTWYLVDLPGVGFAEGKGKQLKAMDRIVTAYVRHRSTLVELLYLVDASIPTQQLDLEGIQYLVNAGIYLTIVFTKTDKAPINARALGDPIERLSRDLWQMKDSPWRLGVKSHLPPMFKTSSWEKIGRKQVLDHMAGIIERCRPRHLVESEVKAQRAAQKTPVQEETGLSDIR